MADTEHEELHGEGGETVLFPLDGRQRIITETEVPPAEPHPESIQTPLKPEVSQQETAEVALQGLGEPLTPEAREAATVKAAGEMTPQQLQSWADRLGREPDAALQRELAEKQVAFTAKDTERAAVMKALEPALPDVPQAILHVNPEAQSTAEPAPTETMTGPAERSKWDVGGRPLWELSADEMNASSEAMRGEDINTLADIFGDREIATKYERLAASNSDRAYEASQRIYDAASPEQQSRLDKWEMGDGSGALSPADIRDYAKAIGRIDDESPESLANSLKYALTAVGDKTNPAEMSGQEMDGYLQLKRGFEIAKERGWDTAAISKQAIEAAAARFTDKNDAAYMLSRFLKDVQSGHVPEVPKLKAPEAPAVESPLTEKFRTELSADHEGAVARYAALSDEKIADTQGDKILNVDMARELSPEYAANRTLSAEVHEPASEFTKKMYAERLAEEPKAGQAPFVMFTAGGTGAGKTSAINASPEIKALADKAQIVYDTNMNNEASASQKIDQALDAGKDVHINYVYRDPVEALTRGALPRAQRMGRTVPLENHAETHTGSFETISKLQEKYKDDPRVHFSIIDNSRGEGEAKPSSLEELRDKRYNVPVQELQSALDREKAAGRISEATYQGTRAKIARSPEETGRNASADGQGALRQPQPQRAEERPLIPDVPQGIGELHVNPSGESTAGAAAASNPTLRGEAIARGAETLAGTIGKVSPGARLMTSPSLETRKLIQELANIPETLTKNYEGVKTASPIERELWKYDGVHHTGMQARGEAYRTYRERIAGEGGRPMVRGEFNQEISKAMRRNDMHEVPEVAKAAKDTRRIEFDPLKDRAMKLGLLPEDVKAKGADSYLMRQYDTQKIKSNLSDWLQRLRQGFQAQGVDAAEAADIAHQASRNVLGAERGTMDWKVLDGIAPKSGQLKERTLNLPDTLLEPYLNNDIDHVAHSYQRSLAPEVEMTERFGSRDMKDQISAVHDDYARMITRAPDDKAKQTLMDRMQHDLRDLNAVRDRLYGIYGQPKDPGHFAVRAGRMLRTVNALRLLGAATLAHFPDMANVMMRFGLPQTFSAIGKVLTSPEAMSLTRAQAKRMGAGLDMAMNATASMLGDYATHSQYAEQRVGQYLARKFTILTGETPLITAVQQLTSTMAQDQLIRSAQKVVQGTAVDKNVLARLASAGIDHDMLTRIAEQHEQFGAKVNGLHFGMSDQWTDKAAASAFESAVLRDAHSVTLRPGVGDTPLFMSTEWGKALRQFTTFGYAAQRSVVNPLMQGLAHGDPRAAQAMFALAAMGTLSYVSKQTAAGQPIEDPGSARFALEVLDKSNLMGWTSDVIFPALWMAGFNNLSRWSDRDPTETIGGPVVGTVFSTYARQLPARFLAPLKNDIDPDAQEKGISRADLHFMRRLMPGQNLWYTRNAVNHLEDAMGDAFDLPGKSNKDRAEELASNTQ
jgi:hypothetical protein